MKRIKKIINNIDTTEIKIMDNFSNLSINSQVLNNEKPFKILVKKGDYIKINEPILVNEDGQNILSDISGKVLNIVLKKDLDNQLIHHIEIENDFKNVELNIENINKENISKNDFINIIKKYGIINKNFLIYKLLENTQNILNLDCFDEFFVFNNETILNDYFNEIKKVIDFIKKLFNIEKVVFFTSINNLKNVNELKTIKDKIKRKKSKKNALNMFDLFKIYTLLFNNKILPYEILSLTGKALKENRVLFVKKGITLEHLIENMGGFVENIEDVENFKYTAMLAYNDEVILKQKIKESKNELDKQKLIKMLNEKQLEAKNNVYEKLEFYHQKYLNCLSACFISIENKKFPFKDMTLILNYNVTGVHFLNYQQFK